MRAALLGISRRSRRVNAHGLLAAVDPVTRASPTRPFAPSFQGQRKPETQPPGIGFTGPTGLVGIVVVVVDTFVDVVLVVVDGVVDVWEVDVEVALEDVTGGATGTPVVSVTVAVDVEVDADGEEEEPAGASTAQATRPPASPVARVSASGPGVPLWV